MLFSRDKEDDDDFFPSPNYQSNLASIFGNSGSDGNSSLTYTAPKQPKQQSKTASSSKHSSTTTVITVKAVHTFRMVDKKYQSHGKMGAAVLGSKMSEEGPYQLLLYREKGLQVCTSLITRDFQFLVQPKNYCTFFDSQGAVWSILFDNVQDMADFTFQMALAKWKTGDPNSPIMVHDLWCPFSSSPDSCTSDIGDNVELTYTLCPINSSQGEVKTVKVNVVEEDWKQGLVGLQPTAQRVIIMQPFMLKGLRSTEAYDSPVVMKLTVLEVSKNRNSADICETLKENYAGKELHKSLSQPSCVESTVKNNSPKAVTKADLISRMARMGKALPFDTSASIPSDSDDTEEDQTGNSRKLERVVPKPRTRAQQPHPSSSISSLAMETPPVTFPMALTQHPVPSQWASSAYMGGNMLAMPQVQSPGDSSAQFNMFLSEVRTTNSELRMGITRLTDKVDVLQAKLNDSEKKPNIEVSSVLERLLENELQLKNQLSLVLSALNNAQPPSQNRPSGDNQLLFESPKVQPCQQCNKNDQRLSELNERIQQLREENEYLQTTVAAQKDALQNAKIADQGQMAKIEELQHQIEEEQTKFLGVSQSFEKSQRDKEIAAEEIRNCNSLIKELQNTVGEKQTSIDKLEQALKDCEATSVEEVRRSLQEVLDPKPVIKEHIMKIFNTVYKFVKIQFQPQNKYDANYILLTLAETIKGVTLEYLENADFAYEEMQKQSLAKYKVSQTQSAPVFSSKQSSHEENQGWHVKEEQCREDDTKNSAPEYCRVLEEGSSPSGSPTLELPSAAETSSAPNHAHNNIGDSHNESSKSSSSQNVPELNSKSSAFKEDISCDDKVDFSSVKAKNRMSEKLETLLVHLTSSQTKLSTSHSLFPLYSSTHTSRQS